MDYRNLLVSAVLAAGIVGLASVSRADMIAADNGIAVEKSDVATPARGMTMNQVASKFGTPTSKVAAVGQPPISRWEYPGFVVYFEHDHVIHSVVSDSAAPAPAPSPESAAPAVEAAPAPADAPAPTN
jgi:hypothetical protein